MMDTWIVGGTYVVCVLEYKDSEKYSSSDMQFISIHNIKN